MISDVSKHSPHSAAPVPCRPSAALTEGRQRWGGGGEGRSGAGRRVERGEGGGAESGGGWEGRAGEGGG